MIIPLACLAAGFLLGAVAGLRVAAAILDGLNKRLAEMEDGAIERNVKHTQPNG